MRNLVFMMMLLVWGLSSVAAAGAARPAVRLERARLPLKAESGSVMVRAGPEFVMRLPEHVQAREGCLLVITLHGALPGDCSATNLQVRFNGRPLACVVPPQNGGKTRPPAPRWGTVVPPEILLPGWNRVSVSMRPGAEDLQPEITIGEDSYFLVVYERLPLFPELFRFPASFGEEKMLRQITDPERKSEPVVTLLIPARRRNVHLQACAVIGARLGQLGYLAAEDCSVGNIEDLEAAAQSQNCILIGRWDELGNLFQQLGTQVSTLDPGQGMVAEFILGNLPRQHRWLLITGRDDVGLEKAILTVGSGAALAEVPPNPAVIQAIPEMPVPLTGPDRVDKVAAGDRPDLGSLPRLLINDRFLRDLVFVLPLNCSTEELGGLLQLAMHFGRQLPESELIWPDACGYAPQTPPPSERLKRRTVLLLGSAPEWNWALPPNVSLPILPSPTAPDLIRIQGRRYPVNSFEPTLGMVQLVDSPWSDGESLVVAGGWQTFAIPSVLRLLTGSGLAGTVAASDASGRRILHDARRGSSYSLAERIQHQIPAHLDLAATRQRVEALQRQQLVSRQLNDWLFYTLPALLLLLVGSRIWFLQDRARTRAKALEGEQPLGAMP